MLIPKPFIGGFTSKARYISQLNTKTFLQDIEIKSRNQKERKRPGLLEKLNGNQEELKRLTRPKKSDRKRKWVIRPWYLLEMLLTTPTISHLREEFIRNAC